MAQNNPDIRAGPGVEAHEIQSDPKEFVEQGHTSGP